MIDQKLSVGDVSEIKELIKDVSMLELYKLILGFTPVVLGLSSARINPDWFVNFVIFFGSLCSVVFGVNKDSFSDAGIRKPYFIFYAML